MTVYEIAACPVCGTQDFRTCADAAEIKRQLESLWEFHTRRLQSGAPVQPLFDRAVFSQDPPLQIVQCRHCRTILRAPRESSHALVDLYAAEDPSDDALQSLFAAQREFFVPRVSLLTKLSGKTGRVLEVGSYIGGFLTAATKAGWNAHGIDVNARANCFARKQGAHVTEASLEDFSSDTRYHVVALWNCLDQLPDPRAALLQAHVLLEKNGLVALRIPNGACYARFHRVKPARALLAYNNLLTFPYRNGFNLASITQLLQQTGFERVVSRGDTLVSTASKWTKRWAAREEMMLKAVARSLLPKKLSPWLEVYARRRQDGVT